MSGITDQFIANDGKMFPPFHQLQPSMNANYRTAQVYYKMKEKIFKKYLQHSARISLNEFQQEMTEKAKSFNKLIVAEAEKRLIAALEGQPIPPIDESKKEFDIYIEDLVKNGIAFKSKNGSRAVTRQGFTFEKYLSEHTMNKMQRMKLNNIALGLIGNMKQIAAITSKKTFIRSDIGINPGSKSNEDAKIELTTVLTLDDFSKYDDNVLGDLLLNAIIENGIYQSMFGFQVKAYDSSNNARWMNSRPLANTLNDLFDSTNENQVTWSNNYAAIYPYYFLSRYLINIINPVNIGIITKEGMEYTSEFLDHYRFYMEVAWNWHKNNPQAADYRGGGEEVSNVHVVGDTILMRQVKTGKSLALQAKNIKSTQRSIHKKVAWVDYT